MSRTECAECGRPLGDDDRVDEALCAWCLAYDADLHHRAENDEREHEREHGPDLGGCS